MAIEKFPFALFGRFRSGAMRDKTVEPGNGGVEVIRVDCPDVRGEYRASNCVIWVPHNGYTADDVHQFWEDVEDGALIFGFKEPIHERFYKVTLEALGTATAAETDFPLDLRYVDESTLLVYEDAVLKSNPGDYTLVGNETAPIVRFGSGMSGGEVITATYEFWIPVVADRGGEDEWPGGGVVLKCPPFEMHEYFAGGRFV